MAPSDEDSLYGSSDSYQAVNDWSGVYQVQTPQYSAQYAYSEPVAQPVMDQSYYESVYAAYSVQQAQQAADATVRVPHDYYGAAPAQPEFYGQPQYEEHNFHHPEFDTGQFEAIYEEPGSVEASYDLLPEGEGAYDAYDGEGYGEGDYLDYEYTGFDGESDYAESDYAESDEDYEDYRSDYRSDYRDGYTGYDADDLADDEPDDLPPPARSRSRSGSGSAPGSNPGPASGGSGRPFGSKAPRVPLSGRRTLHAITSTPAAVVGVAAVAVAAVGGLRLPSGHTEATADASPATPTTNALEQNLLQMRAASANMADRATRSEQRSELAQQQALEKQRLAEMAPKYFLPVQDYMLTAGFGDSGARWVSLHTGQDFAVPTGTKVVAVTDGTVIEANYAGAFGNRIVIQHPDGSETWYCHLSVIKVRSGKVAAGQIIALSGDTGNSTGPHLHFEYHPPGQADPMNGVPGASTAVNPIPFLRSHGLLP
jgi:murein DD-endopeptidase MepM/ murein hydrolase activator NlpD